MMFPRSDDILMTCDLDSDLESYFIKLEFCFPILLAAPGFVLLKGLDRRAHDRYRVTFKISNRYSGALHTALELSHVHTSATWYISPTLTPTEVLFDLLPQCGHELRSTTVHFPPPASYYRRTVFRLTNSSV